MNEVIHLVYMWKPLGQETDLIRNIWSLAKGTKSVQGAFNPMNLKNVCAEIRTPVPMVEITSQRL